MVRCATNFCKIRTRIRVKRIHWTKRVTDSDSLCFFGCRIRCLMSVDQNENSVLLFLRKSEDSSTSIGVVNISQKIDCFDNVGRTQDLTSFLCYVCEECYWKRQCKFPYPSYWLYLKFYDRGKRKGKDKTMIILLYIKDKIMIILIILKLFKDLRNKYFYNLVTVETS